MGGHPGARLEDPLSAAKKSSPTSPRCILAIDVGGTNIKIKCNISDEVRKIASGPHMTAEHMVTAVKELARDWEFEAVSMGYPGPVRRGAILREPYNLGRGWMAFEFAEAFGVPVRIINDAAMQALGCYAGGSMLFLGLGTGLGTVLIVNGEVQPMELAHLPYRQGRTYEDFAGRKGRDRLGRKDWRRAVIRMIDDLTMALQPDYVALGGGEAKKLGDLPPNCRLGTNADAFVGGFKLWD